MMQQETQHRTTNADHEDDDDDDYADNLVQEAIDEEVNVRVRVWHHTINKSNMKWYPVTRKVTMTLTHVVVHRQYVYA